MTTTEKPATNADDMEKIRALGASIETLALPEVADQDAADFLETIHAGLMGLAKKCEQYGEKPR